MVVSVDEEEDEEEEEEEEQDDENTVELFDALGDQFKVLNKLKGVDIKISDYFDEMKDKKDEREKTILHLMKKLNFLDKNL